jgi:hypothetical protein
MHQTTEGTKYVLVIVDVFTRFVATHAMPDQLAATVAAGFLKAWIPYFGPPLRLLSDNGPNFTSELFQETLRLLEIKGVRTSPYNPRGNGIVERFNRTMAEMLAKFGDARQSDWDTFLPLVTSAYNTSSHAALGQSPHAAMLSFNPFPLVPIAEPTSFSEWTSLSKFGGEVREAILSADKIISGLQSTTVNTEVYKIGDLVLVRKHTVGKGLSRKLLLQQWVGPYRVLRSTGALEKSLILVSADSDEKQIRASFRNVKRYIPRQTPHPFNTCTGPSSETNKATSKLTTPTKRHASPTASTIDDGKSSLIDEVTSADAEPSGTNLNNSQSSNPLSINYPTVQRTKSSSVVLGDTLHINSNQRDSTTTAETTPRINRLGRESRRPTYMEDYVQAQVALTQGSTGPSPYSDDDSDDTFASE